MLIVIDDKYLNNKSLKKYNFNILSEYNVNYMIIMIKDYILMGKGEKESC